MADPISQSAPPDTVHVVLVNEQDDAIGTMPKLEAHKPPGHLHRAFSVFVFDSRGRALLHRRAASKYHFGGLWTNACCSHPRANEAVADAARRRLREEMGLHADCTPRFSFLYEASDPVGGLIERELDHVCTAVCDEDPAPDPSEADDWRWISPADLDAEIREAPERFTPWFRIAWPTVRDL
ncbi:MAG: isopentenyl-diphosphate Delta-isomerase [Planctomycetota bacterium]